MSARMPIASSADRVRAAAATIRRWPPDRARRTPWSSRRAASPGCPTGATPIERRHHGRMAMLLSVNVGLPRDVTWNGQTVHTGIWKQPVAGPVMARRLNLDGDGQGDLGGHGGEQRAVMVYQAQSYEHWRQHLGRSDLGWGSFGENFTVDGLPDDQVCVGDRYRIGEAEFEVTQPRVTCYRVGLRLDEPQMPALLVAHHRPGFYLRVLREGRVRAGDDIVQVGAAAERVSVAVTDAQL